MPQLFGYVIQGQRIDTGFLGAAQIDRHGSLNSTLIGGSYARPEHRLPGSGGAIEVMAHAREVFVVMRRHTPQTLVDRLDFVTSPAPRGRRTAGHRPGRHPPDHPARRADPARMTNSSCARLTPGWTSARSARPPGGR